MGNDMQRAFIRATFALATFTGVVAAAPDTTRADTIQLGFILDESGSISSSEWNTIKNGLATAINNLIPIGGPNFYEISVIKFDSTAETVVNRQLVTTAAQRTAVATAVAGMVQQGGSTNYQVAFNLMQTILTTGGNLPALSFVNMATDGEPNQPINAEAAAVTARNALIAAGIDNISVEGIGVSGSAASFLQSSICYPGPCDATSPYNFPTQGFYIGVANAQGYADAIGNKILVVTQQTPEPASMAVLGVGLLGLGALRRRVL